MELVNLCTQHTVDTRTTARFRDHSATRLSSRDALPEPEESQMTSPIRIGVIGLGAIGQNLLKAFTANSEVHVTAVCDVDLSLAERTAQPLAASVWTDHRQMLDEVDLDLVYVAVPPKHHHAIALDVIAAGRHILCEKPLALTLSEAQDMQRAAQARGVVHALNLPMHGDLTSFSLSGIASLLVQDS